MTDTTRRDWKQLAQLAAAEQDPVRLLEIVAELNAALLERERQGRGQLSSRRLLLVDDENSIRLTLLPALQEHGFEVEFAATVRDAIFAIGSREFDALVCDLNISAPGDGFEVVSAMRKAAPRSVIVLLTGYPAFESAVEGIHHQVDEYIVKPVDYDLLIDTLEQKLATPGRR
jgi:DNA-binding NtrC family response regulator